MPTAVIVGAGAAGLTGALLLARRGWQVDVLERDTDDLPAAPADLARWRRHGLTQTWHSHAFLARCRSLLAEHAPEVLDALRVAGALEIGLAANAPTTLTGPAPTDGDLVVLGCRRALLDWTLRRVVAAEPGVTIRSAARVVGLRTEQDPPAGPHARRTYRPVRVLGVRLADGTRRDADLVIDAAGRLSPVRRWLVDAGADLPTQTEVACGITYYSRFYRRGGAAPAAPLNRGHTAGASFDRYSCLVFPADNDVFSVTFGVLPEDTEIRVLRHDGAFDAAARSIDLTASWLDGTRARPVTSVTAMSNLNNRLRPLVVDERPGVLGLLTIGDAAVITNPAHTRGVTLAVLAAVRLAETVSTIHDPVDRALAMDASLRADLEPWFHDSCAQDAARLLRWRSVGLAALPHTRGAPVPEGAPPTGYTPRPERAPRAAGARTDVPNGEVNPVTDGPLTNRAGADGPGMDGAAVNREVTNGEAYLASRRDPEIWHRFARLQNLLAAPSDVLADPVFAARVRSVLATGWRPAPVPGPSHGDLVAIATEAARRLGATSIPDAG